MGAIAREARALGIRASVGCPIVVGGRLWGVIAASTNREEPFPADTEAQIARFTELVATAVANAQAREELQALAEEQATLRRVATLVARGVGPELALAAVAEEVGALFDADLTVVVRFEPDGEATLLASHGLAQAEPGMRAKPDPGLPLASVRDRPRRPLRGERPVGEAARALPGRGRPRGGRRSDHRRGPVVGRDHRGVAG
jgi:GAF domain-containing protein